MPAADWVIEVEGLSRMFGDFRAVDRVDFKVRRGEVFGFLGANGAGKTTTIRMLLGVLAPSSGKGRVFEYDIMTESEKVKSRAGYMSQKFSLYPDLTVFQNLDFFGGIYRLWGKRLRERKQWAVEMAGLQGKEDTLTDTLSQGWKQRLALGAALLHEPELLFLDEPTAGVSPDARRDFWDLIHLLSSGGTTVFVTSHYMDEVEHCDRIGLMSRGRLVVLDTPEGLKRDAVGGEMVALECRAPLSVVREALSGPDLLDVQPFGSSFHALVARDAGGAEVVIRAMEEAGLAVDSAVVVEPSLEDVFIAVISREER